MMFSFRSSRSGPHAMLAAVLVAELTFRPRTRSRPGAEAGTRGQAARQGWRSPRQGPPGRGRQGLQGPGFLCGSGTVRRGDDPGGEGPETVAPLEADLRPPQQDRSRYRRSPPGQRRQDDEHRDHPAQEIHHGTRARGSRMSRPFARAPRGRSSSAGLPARRCSCC